VKSGDTLAGVARKLHIGKSDLAEANDLTMSARLSVGQQLMVPTGVPYVSYAAAPAKKTAPAKAPAGNTTTTSKKK
jgi:LysM repeat protein